MSQLHHSSSTGDYHQSTKINKTMLSPHLTVIELGPPMLESSTGSQILMHPPLILNTNFIKRESKISYPWYSIWDRLDWEPAVITTTLCSTTNGFIYLSRTWTRARYENCIHWIIKDVPWNTSTLPCDQKFLFTQQVYVTQFWRNWVT